MPSHLSSIGVPVRSQEELLELLERIADRGEVVPAASGSYRRCASRCGAELWLRFDDQGSPRGMTPCFRGSGLVRARLTARIERGDGNPLDCGFHAWAAPSNDDPGSGSYPLIFDSPDFECHRDRALPALVDARIAAFAHDVRCHATEEIHLAAQLDEPKMATQSFIPAGLWRAPGDDDAPPEAHATFSGLVRATAWKTNDWTGARYRWALVDSYDASFDVVIDPELLGEAPVVGGVLEGAFWLCGTIAPALH